MNTLQLAKLKEHLLQEKVKGVQWLQKPYFWAAQGHLPITPNIGKLLFGKRINAFHITSPNNALNLKALEGRKKSISAMTTVPDNLLDISGVHGHGVMFSLEGNLLFKFAGDIMSSPDETGRRWIDVSIIDRGLGDQFSEYMSGSKRLNSLRQKLKASYNKKIGDDPSSVYNDRMIKSKTLPLSNEELRELLDLWVKRAEEWMQSHSEEFIRILESKKYGDTDYDEVVVNEIELVAAIVNITQLVGTDSQIKKMKRNIEAAVGGEDNVVYVDSAKNQKQSKDAVTNFITGNGGKIG